MLKENLDKKPKVLKQYSDIINDQLEKGVIEVVSDENEITEKGKVTYLPHHDVIREDKSSTKLRIVYDASAKSKNGISLNDCLYKGPYMSTMLYELFLKFKTHFIAITADIEKAYLQISVKEEHRNLLRFLWFDDPFKKAPNIIKMRFCRVTFGANCSQYLLTSIIHRHGDKYKALDPEFCRKVKAHFYVDDLNTGTNNINSGNLLYRNMKERFLDINFNLRKWRTNDKKLRGIIENSEILFNNGGNENLVNHTDKVLGVTWNDLDDVLIFNIREMFMDALEIIPTKRNILKLIASAYDPIGFLQPIWIKLKMLFQNICRLNIDWDDNIGDLKISWRKIILCIQAMENIILDRCYFINEISDPINNITLHGFSNASELAYGACIYIKSIYRSGNIIVKLVTSKSRVIPMKKKYSIPRLELLGAFILSKLTITVLNALKCEICIDDHFCYIDSQIALAWILSINKELKTFCQNRVDVIRKNVDISKWLYVKSSENPADIITRLNDCDLSENSIWFKGPSFLYLSEIYDKKLFVVENDSRVYLKHNSDISKEVNSNDYYEKLHVIQTNVSLVSEIKGSNISEILNITNYSELQKLLRFTSYILRFINNIKRKLKKEKLILNEYVSSNELKESLYLWLKDNQNSFINDSSFENRKRNLMVDIDKNGLYGLMGRLGNASLSFNTKFPILLNNDHYLTEFIVKDSHSGVLHNGLKHTLADVRKNYWIIRGRNYIRKILGKCVICNKVNSRSYGYPGTSNLPKSRVDGGIPFNYVGIDYFGPLYYKAVTQPLFYVTTTSEIKQMMKCYVILYTCTTTRGILLDLVKDGNTKTLINSLRTFIARRGCPKGVISDNAKVFSADETQTFCSRKGISWNFNLAKAPWQGGFWERLVALCKRYFKQQTFMLSL